MNQDWSGEEISLILADYFSMLEHELKGIEYNKTAKRKALLPLLNNRSEGSIEFKHQNISAVLVDLGQPFIKGYKPRYNYQSALKDHIIKTLPTQTKLETLFEEFADRTTPLNPSLFQFEYALDSPPKLEIVRDKSYNYSTRAIKINYLQREQNNSLLGESGESFVLEFEKWQLKQSGLEKYVDKIEWVSKTIGDGMGYDILSRNRNGTDKYIEVKTTKLSKQSPFYFSRNELLFSKENAINYHLYRVFEFDKKPRIFTLNGSLDKVCSSVPETYKGYF